MAYTELIHTHIERRRHEHVNIHLYTHKTGSVYAFSITVSTRALQLLNHVVMFQRDRLPPGN